MAERWFQPKVPVRTPEGHRYNVGSVEAAADVLLTWTKRGRHWGVAVACCMAALEDKATPQEVRRTFKLAAKEEGKLLPEISE
ncbi:DUF982 domain-containing protein [Mesorhizobium sp. XAP10]|uniref:DUF982 domain-containing protein n=1 Tax=unclassified Mesorhizobium TaxID=325217 RepID=UPI0023DED1B8|nr:MULTISPECIES: DUF982 domain-containing protein [unclassified Mesorhizobium]MDF3153252.1 DUF982 domain-containing protein [Mesorhizobium sp. XAP10]MDF3246450.1 DUF982 domain-containing protein [Mesorhizobium sp. XAP4]